MSYERELRIWIDDCKCEHCGEPKRCLCIDPSEGEYYAEEGICVDCILDLFIEDNNSQLEGKKRA